MPKPRSKNSCRNDVKRKRIQINLTLALIGKNARENLVSNQKTGGEQNSVPTHGENAKSEYFRRDVPMNKSKNLIHFF